MSRKWGVKYDKFHRLGGAKSMEIFSGRRRVGSQSFGISPLLSLRGRPKLEISLKGAAEILCAKTVGYQLSR